MVARALLVVVLVLVGCGPSGGRAAGVAPAASSAPAIEWRADSGLSAEQRSTVEARWRMYLEIEARARGAAPVRVDVVRLWGWDVGELPHRPGNSGWASWDARGRVEVDLLIGAGLELDAAYHELCHVRARLSTHDDPRWPLWEQERAAAVAEVLAR